MNIEHNICSIDHLASTHHLLFLSLLEVGPVKPSTYWVSVWEGERGSSTSLFCSRDIYPRPTILITYFLVAFSISNFLRTTLFSAFPFGVMQHMVKR